MKRIKLILLTITLPLLFIHCSNDDDSNETNDDSMMQEAQNLMAIAMDGTWIISNFIDSGENETNDFQGYQFTFASNGVLTASNGTNTLTGTWSVTTSSSDSNDDDGSSSDNDIDFNIFFQVSEDNDFEDLNDDWDITSSSSSEISLFDISGGDGSTDVLVFTKL